MDVDFLTRGVVFAAAAWVLCACVWRLNLMQWGKHQCAQLLAYLLLGLWAGAYILALPDVHPLGVVGVALLFLGGRKRWLTQAPDDTARATR